jgi:hypothetical protein
LLIGAFVNSGLGAYLFSSFIGELTDLSMIHTIYDQVEYFVDVDYLNMWIISFFKGTTVPVVNVLKSEYERKIIDPFSTRRELLPVYHSTNITVTRRLRGNYFPYNKAQRPIRRVLTPESSNVFIVWVNIPGIPAGPAKKIVEQELNGSTFFHSKRWKLVHHHSNEGRLHFHLYILDQAVETFLEVEAQDRTVLMDPIVVDVALHMIAMIKCLHGCGTLSNVMPFASWRGVLTHCLFEQKNISAESQKVIHTMLEWVVYMIMTLKSPINIDSESFGWKDWLLKRHMIEFDVTGICTVRAATSKGVDNKLFGRIPIYPAAHAWYVKNKVVLPSSCIVIMNPSRFVQPSDAQLVFRDYSAYDELIRVRREDTAVSFNAKLPNEIQNQVNMLKEGEKYIFLVNLGIIRFHNDENIEHSSDTDGSNIINSVGALPSLDWYKQSISEYERTKERIIWADEEENEQSKSTLDDVMDWCKEVEEETKRMKKEKSSIQSAGPYNPFIDSEIKKKKVVRNSKPVEMKTGNSKVLTTKQMRKKYVPKVRDTKKENVRRQDVRKQKQVKVYRPKEVVNQVQSTNEFKGKERARENGQERIDLKSLPIVDNNVIEISNSTAMRTARRQRMDKYLLELGSSG